MSEAERKQLTLEEVSDYSLSLFILTCFRPDAVFLSSHLRKLYYKL